MSLTMLFVVVSLFFLTIASYAGTVSSSSDPPLIGVTYSNRRTSNRVQHQQQLVATLESLKINSIRLTDSDPEVIRSFSYCPVNLLITIPNSLIPSIASNPSEALHWLNRHVTPFYPRVHISLISVGNNILGGQSQADSHVSKFLLSAMSNVRNALDELGINKISVSTTFSFADVITSPFPPSSSEFKETVAEYVIKPLLNFLSETNSSFLINIYPYNMYRTTVMIPLGFAIFQEPPFMYRDDSMTGLRYRNLYDMMVDSVITAMGTLGHENVPVIVAETGWPSVDEANKLYAEMYLKGLVRHVRSGKGTPLRKNAVAETYIFELFDEDDDGSDDLTGQWGILNHDMSQKYNIDFTSDAAPRRSDRFWRMIVCIWWLGAAIGTCVRICDDDLPMCARLVLVGVLAVRLFWWIISR